MEATPRGDPLGAQQRHRGGPGEGGQPPLTHPHPRRSHGSERHHHQHHPDAFGSDARGHAGPPTTPPAAHQAPMTPPARRPRSPTEPAAAAAAAVVQPPGGSGGGAAGSDEGDDGGRGGGSDEGGRGGGSDEGGHDLPDVSTKYGIATATRGTAVAQGPPTPVATWRGRMRRAAAAAVAAAAAAAATGRRMGPSSPSADAAAAASTAAAAALQRDVARDVDAGGGGSLPGTPKLQDLPGEVLLQVCDHLPLTTCCGALPATCRSIRDVLSGGGPAAAPPAVAAPAVETPVVAPPAVAAPAVEIPAAEIPAVAPPAVEPPSAAAAAAPAAAAPSVAGRPVAGLAVATPAVAGPAAGTAAEVPPNPTRPLGEPAVGPGAPTRGPTREQRRAGNALSDKWWHVRAVDELKLPEATLRAVEMAGVPWRDAVLARVRLRGPPAVLPTHGSRPSPAAGSQALQQRRGDAAIAAAAAAMAVLPTGRAPSVRQHAAAATANAAARGAAAGSAAAAGAAAAAAVAAQQPGDWYDEVFELMYGMIEQEREQQAAAEAAAAAHGVRQPQFVPRRRNSGFPIDYIVPKQYQHQPLPSLSPPPPQQQQEQQQQQNPPRCLELRLQPPPPPSQPLVPAAMPSSPHKSSPNMYGIYEKGATASPFTVDPHHRPVGHSGAAPAPAGPAEAEPLEFNTRGSSGGGGGKRGGECTTTVSSTMQAQISQLQHQVGSAGGGAATATAAAVTSPAVVTCALAANTGGTRALLCGPMGRWLVVASHADEQNLVRLDLDTGRAEELKGHTRGVRDIAADSEAGLLASAGWDNRLIVWELQDASIRHFFHLPNLMGGFGYIRYVAVGGGKVAVAQVHALLVYDADSGDVYDVIMEDRWGAGRPDQQRFPANLSMQYVRALRITPDGRWLILATSTPQADRYHVYDLRVRSFATCLVHPAEPSPRRALDEIQPVFSPLQEGLLVTAQRGAGGLEEEAGGAGDAAAAGPSRPRSSPPRPSLPPLLVWDLDRGVRLAELRVTLGPDVWPVGAAPGAPPAPLQSLTAALRTARRLPLLSLSSSPDGIRLYLMDGRHQIWILDLAAEQALVATTVVTSARSAATRAQPAEEAAAAAEEEEEEGKEEEGTRAAEAAAATTTVAVAVAATAAPIPVRAASAAQRQLQVVCNGQLCHRAPAGRPPGSTLGGEGAAPGSLAAAEAEAEATAGLATAGAAVNAAITSAMPYVCDWPYDTAARSRMEWLVVPDMDEGEPVYDTCSAVRGGSGAGASAGWMLQGGKGEAGVGDGERGEGRVSFVPERQVAGDGEDEGVGLRPQLEPSFIRSLGLVANPLWVWREVRAGGGDGRGGVGVKGGRGSG